MAFTRDASPLKVMPPASLPAAVAASLAAAAAMALSSVSVIGNSLRLRRIAL